MKKNNRAISIEGLSYHYPKAEKDCLKNISFNVEKGEIFGFLGPSGAGKSTTVKILTGLLRGFSGRAEVCGRQLGGKKRDAAFYENIGVSFELPWLYGRFTAMENLDLFASFYSNPEKDLTGLLTRLGLEADANTKVEKFSKGMKMRLNLARSFVGKPSLLFLDEPTSGLDPATAKSVRNLIKQKREEGATVFLTTHSMETAADLCDRLAFMLDGKLPLIDSPRNLMLKYGKASLSVEYEEGGKAHHRFFSMGPALATDRDFLGLLQSGTVKRMHSQEASLEDVFIKLTGRGLS